MLQVLFRVDTAVDGERAEVGRHIEIRSGLDAPAEQQNGFAGRRRSNIVFRHPKLNFLLDLG